MIGMARWKIWTVVGVCLAGIAFAAPNLLPAERAASLPDWLPHRQVSLGLDLQGGAHMLLEVDVASVQRERLTNLLDGVRTAMRTQRVAVTNLSVLPDGSGITFRVRDAADVEKARNAVREIDSRVQIATQADGTFTLTHDPREISENNRRVLVQSVEIVRRRVDEMGTKEPTIQAQGEDRILLQVPGLTDAQRLRDIIGRTAKMTFHLLDSSTPVSEARQGRVPPGTELLPSDKEVEPDGRPRTYLVQRRIAVSGDRLTDAQPGTNPQTGEWVVNFKFDGVGARQFGQVTRDNVGRPFAIVLDGKVITAPVIREPILGGSGQISGSFSAQSASDLAVLLRAGALPAPLTVLEERTVGPDLGSDSIEAGATASVIAVVAVMVFMVLGYGTFGLFSVVSLLINLVLIIGAVSGIGFTLTLPGIAGIVLTMGMAVDANVLIYERIREELRHGRTPLSAIEVGFERATATIIDSNLTTLIAALLLFMLGSGPVRGFAVILCVGILSSMFTAVLVTRLQVMGWYGYTRPKVLAV